MNAAEEASSMLKYAEAGYKHRFGSVPLDVRIDLAKAWIDLAHAEAREKTSDHE